MTHDPAPGCRGCQRLNDQTDIAHGFGVINRFFAYGVPAIDVIQFDTKIQGSPLTLKGRSAR